MTAGMHIKTIRADETIAKKVPCWVSNIMVGCESKDSVGGRRGDRLGRSLSLLQLTLAPQNKKKTAY
jgi:hypothetical protein